MTKIRSDNSQKVHKNLRLRELREAAGLSQEALGKKIGMSSMAISHIETGKRQVSSDMVKRLSDFFGCTADYLLYRDGTDDPRTPPHEASAASLLALAGEISARPALAELLMVAQGVDDDMLEAAAAMLRTYMQRKNSKEQQ